MLLGGVSAHGMTKKHHHSSTPLIGHHKKKGKKGKEPLILLPSSLRGWIVCICVSQLLVCGLCYLTPYLWFSLVIGCGAVLGLCAACFRARRLVFAYVALTLGIMVCEGLTLAMAVTTQPLHPVRVFIYIISTVVQIMALVQGGRYWMAIRGSEDIDSDSDDEAYSGEA